MIIRGWSAGSFLAGAVCVILPNVLSAQAMPYPVDTISLGPPTGVLHGSEGFTSVVGVRELPDGRVLVTDQPVHRLVVVDFAQSSVAAIGREGHGPGEYIQPGRLFPLKGDSTLLTDFVSRRWFVLAGTEIVSTIPAFRPANALLGADLNGADTEGRVAGVEGYGYTHVQVPGGRATADSLRAYLVGGALSDGPLTIDTLGHLAGGGRFGVEIRRNPPYVSIIPNPLAIEDQVLLFPDGWIAFAFTDPYRVEWRRPDGTITTGGPLQKSRIRVTKGALCAIMRRKGSESCGHIEVPDVPKFLPPFLGAALLPAPDGSLLVRRAPLDNNAPNYYDVVDRSGIVRHVLRLAGNQWIVGSGPESLYVVTEDQLDLEWLTRHHWPFGRGGT